ncbi:hypothetical protein BY458DRAFT_494284 [Sporodiniella umbellata]|nr:hypothetical protein BY458DRAFT_494284 [Sporodiniella umbellata]
MFAGRIYSAVYSGVAVFEMIVNGVAVMRRQKDSYMNATQILKVANIDKGKRTKILEKEVLLGEHEKVQGGYGKYQGTWIPFDKSKELAERYNVLELLSPLFEFDVNCTFAIEDLNSLTIKEQTVINLKESPETTSAVYRQPLSLSKPKESEPIQPLKADQQKQSQHHELQAQKHTDHAASRQDKALLALSPQLTNNSQPTLTQPYYTSQTRTISTNEDDEKFPVRKKAKTVDSARTLQNHAEGSITKTESRNEAEDENKRNVLMSIFLEDSPEKMADFFDVDTGIDEPGNTALHWAAALARMNVTEKLIEKNANVSCTNYSGETPLMRVVLVTNNFDNQTFPKMLELLGNSMAMLDNKKRSVLHHACLAAGVSDRANAAVYYVDLLLKNITKNDEYRYIIDLQDSLGDTATTIAARLNSTNIMGLLLKSGATKVTENNAGLVSDDYEEDRAFSASNSQEISKAVQSDVFSLAKKLHGPSQRGKEIVATVQKIVDELDNEYGSQLENKEQQLNTIQEELNNITKELELTRKEVEKRQIQSQKLSEAQQKTRNIQNALEIGWSRLEKIMEEAGREMPNRGEIDDVDENEDIDRLFGIDEIQVPDNTSEDEKKRLTKERIQKLQAVIKAYKINDGLLQQEIEEMQNQFAEKEMQCKRLIAACCNLPLEKIDDLVEPLTLAIESDPPDLDLARVIGFMDKVKRQGAFPDAHLNSSINPSRTTRESPLLSSEADTNNETEFNTSSES